MTLNKKERGDRISAVEYNQIVDVVNKKLPFPNQQNTRDTAKAKYIEVYSSVDVPEYSVFGITSQVGGGSYDASEPARATVRYVPLGSPLGLFTNDSLALVAGTWGHARPINDYETTRLASVGAIGIGHPCGVKPGTYAIEAGRFGFVCVADSVEAGFIEVVRVAEPCSIVGVVHSRISRFDPRNNKPGRGYVKLLHRINSGSLVTSKDPDSLTTPWLFQVFNLGRQPIEEGIVICENVLGVGLVARKVLDEFASSSSSYSTSYSSDLR